MSARRELVTIEGRAMFTARQAATLVGMSESWVRKAGRVGVDFPAPVRAGGNAKRWRAEDLRRWLDDRASGAA